MRIIIIRIYISVIFIHFFQKMGCCYSCMDEVKNNFIDICLCCRCQKYIHPDNYDEDGCYSPSLYVLFPEDCLEKSYFTKVTSKTSAVYECCCCLPNNILCPVVGILKCLYFPCSGTDSRSQRDEDYYNSNGNSASASASDSDSQRLSSIVSLFTEQPVLGSNRLTLV